MPALTPELRQEIAKAGGNPVRLEDPETNTAYVLLRAEEYDRLKPGPRPEKVPAEQVPEGIRRSREAFLRELPGLLARKRLHRRWALYRGDVQIGIARRPEKLLRKGEKLGLRNDEFYLGVIEPHAQEPEEIERSLFEFEECEPVS
jgi:hypothetical protein